MFYELSKGIKMNSIIYLRRSKESEDKTVSLAVQEQACREYATRNNLAVVAILADDGVSGTIRYRFEAIRDNVAYYSAKHIIFYSLDRFGRDIAGLLDELKAYEKAGVTIHCTTQNKEISTAKAHEFLAVGVEALMAEHYSRLISEKTKDAMKRLKEQGRRRSRYLPVGTRLVDGKIMLDWDKTALIEKAKCFRKEGLTLREIDIRLRGMGLKLALSTWAKVLR
jgi:DNA invertase Pin-like site-specific DNA recombinase